MSDPAPHPPSGRLGQFLHTYSGFLSSFVIGVAGLIATSVWQYRQAEIAKRQADSQEQIARTKAENDWRIARAEILAKNLDVLSAQGPGNADRRFGVLLSLTRGAILDPELAVSYALELGRDNATYMRAVLAATSNKNYEQLAQAFVLSCLQKYGVERDAEACLEDRLVERSDAIADIIRDDLIALGHTPTEARHGPMSLFLEEDEVQRQATRLSWLFEPYLQGLYEHRRWTDIERFEQVSPGARLIAALTLATARTGELLGTVEAKQAEEFHLKRRQWLVTYVVGRSCEQDCRAQLVDFMLSTVRESDGDYDDVFKQILSGTRAKTGQAIDRVHMRLLWCQIDAEDGALLRDRVIVPIVRQLMAQPPKDPLVLDDLVSVLALVPMPTAADALQAYSATLAAIKADDRLQKLFTSRQARAARQRANPPPMVRKMNFCGAALPASRGGL